MANEQDGKVHQPEDKVLRALLQSKKAFMQLLRYFLSVKWTRLIDEQSLVCIDKSFVQQDFAGKEADILYQCRMNEQDVVFYVLLEFQSTVDQQMPWRLLQYMVEAWRNCLKNEEEADRRTNKFRLPAVIPVVLYLGRPTWTALRSFREYQHRQELFDDCLVDFRYLLVDLRRFDDEQLRHLKGILPLALRLECARNSHDLLRRLETSMEALKDLSSDEVDFIRSYIHHVLAPMAKGIAKEVIYSLANTMTVESMKGGNDMISNAAETIRKEIISRQRLVRRQGKLEGLKQGIQQGKQEGKQEMIRSFVATMHQDGMTPDEISKVTHLPIDEVKELLNCYGA